MATTTKVILQADASQLRRELASVDQRLKTVQEGFGRLKSAIAGLAIGNFIQQTIRSAATMDALAKSTGIAAANIRGFQLAVTASGGSSDKANDAISDLVKNIGEAAAGSGELQKTFGRLGVSLEDLRNLSEQEILSRTVQGLSQIQDNATRSAMGMRLFGEAVKTVDMNSVNQGLDEFTRRSQGIGATSQAAAQAQANMSLAFAQVADGILAALLPITSFVASIEDLGNKFKNVLTIGLQFVTLVLTFTLLGRAAQAIRAGFAAVIIPLQGISEKLIAVAHRFTNGGKAAQKFSDFLAGLAAGPISWLLTAFPRLALFVERWGTAIKLAAGSLAATFGFNYGADKLNEAAEAAKKKEAADSALAKTGAATRAVIDAQAAAQKKANDEARKSAEELRGQLQALNELSNGYKSSIANAGEYYELATANIGLSERQKEANDMRFQNEQAYLGVVNDLLKQYSEAREKALQGDANSAKIMPQIAAALEQVTEAYSQQIGAVDRLTQARARALGQDQLIKFQTQEQIRLQRDLQKVQDDTAKLGMTRIEQKYYDITAAARASAQAAIEAEQARRGSDLDVDEVKAYYAAALAGTEKLKRAQADFSQQSRSFSTGWKQAFNDYVDDATNASKVAGQLFNKFTSGIEDALVEFTKTGKLNWRKFVADMSEELLRSQIRKTIAGLGQQFGLGDLFGSGGTPGSSPNNPMYAAIVGSGGGVGGALAGAMGGGSDGEPSLLSKIGSSISGLFGGGKDASGKEKPSLLSRAGSAISGLFGGGKDASGKEKPSLLSRAGSAISGLFGGSKPPGGVGPTKPSILQRAGSAVSGLFGGSKPGQPSLLSKAGSAISGLFSSGKSKGGGILDSVVKGAKSLFGGFFANGGTLPRGKFGIVGERGPEMISGPGQITPLQGMGGGSTNVTYNISAVDAASFQALVARDPGFIHAVAMQGARGIPAKR
jgi:lambda family phage tail tape measure protein